MEVRHASQRSNLHWYLGDLVFLFHRLPLAGERQHPRVHSQKSEGQSVAAGEQSYVIFTGKSFETTLIALSSCLWSRLFAFAEHCAQRRQSGEY